jgi:hypothetical protein
MALANDKILLPSTDSLLESVIHEAYLVSLAHDLH